MIKLEGLDYVDFGCTTAGAKDLMTKRFAAKEGLHLSDDPKQIALANAAGGKAEKTAFQSRDQFLGKIRFSYIGGCLERQPDLASVASIVDIAIHISRSFVFIRLPWFDSDGALLNCGLKFNWSDTSRHTMSLTTLQMYRLLAPRLGSGGIVRFAIFGNRLIETTTDERLLPLSAPRNSGKYSVAAHGPKPKVPLPALCYAEQVVLIARKSPEHLDWVASRFRQLSPIVDSGGGSKIPTVSGVRSRTRTPSVPRPAPGRVTARQRLPSA